MKLLEVKNLKKYYRTKEGYIKAVDGISFDIEEKRTLGIVGESGSGKTTLAKLITRLIEPDSGNIYFEGNDLIRLSNKRLRLLRKDLQIIFQDPFNSLDPRFNVFKIICEGLDNFFNYSFKEKIKKCKEILEEVGLSKDILFYYPHQFSGGERQRISIARSLILNPRLLILDEPVSSLDVSTQAQIINLLFELQKKFNLTYIFISHDLNIIRNISDEVCVMYLGKIVERAKTQELFNNPINPYTKLLISSIPYIDKKIF